MTEPTVDQAQIAHEVLAGTRQITGSASVTITEEQPGMPAGLSDEAKQQLTDVRASLSQEIGAASANGEVNGFASQPELEHKQWAFERSEVAQDIQKVNDIKGPGE